MPRFLIASVAAALLVLIAIGGLALIAAPGEITTPKERKKYTAIVPAKETCQVIDLKLEQLREQSSGGACEEAKDCGIIGQACVSVQRVTAAEVNAEFDRLLDKANEMDCDVGYLICEFVVASCNDGQCVIERAVLEPPSMPN